MAQAYERARPQIGHVIAVLAVSLIQLNPPLDPTYHLVNLPPHINSYLNFLTLTLIPLHSDPSKCLLGLRYNLYEDTGNAAPVPST